jgi:hypothetical protein
MNSEGWEPRRPGPHGSRYDPRTGTLRLPDRWSLTFPRSVAPFVQQETQVWVRPSTAACFPLHPLWA